MKYAQHKKGQKLHLVYELPTGGLTQPVCGKKVDGYRLNINLPLAMSCKNCIRRLNAKSYTYNMFLKPYFN